MGPLLSEDFIITRRLIKVVNKLNALSLLLLQKGDLLNMEIRSF